jgi:AcrR family transcriptional regulator
MAGPVKKRVYESPRRREQAAETRRQILAAAQSLFERDGYAVTTMAAIATESGVALKTVYLAFATKSGLLRALWNLLLRGDETDVPVAGRDWYREVLEEEDPVRQLELNARNSREGKQRIGAVVEVIRAAAGIEPEIGSLWERIQSDYRQNQRAIVASLVEKRALRADLELDHAADILWTINHPSVWQLLVRERGWSPEAYERWCSELACAQLLEAWRPRPGRHAAPGRSRRTKP